MYLYWQLVVIHMWQNSKAKLFHVVPPVVYVAVSVFCHFICAVCVLCYVLLYEFITIIGATYWSFMFVIIFNLNVGSHFLKLNDGWN